MKLLFYHQAYRPFNRSITDRKGQKINVFRFYRHRGLYRCLGKFSHWWGRHPASCRDSIVSQTMGQTLPV